jgi:thioredoxin-related protein
MKKISLLSLLMFATLVISGQISFETKSLDKIKKQAAKKEKFIFIDAYTTWCAPCKWMSKNVFTDEEVGDFFNEHFVNLKLDMEKGEGLDFAKQYKIVAYPTLIVIDSDGNLIHRRIGAVPPEGLLQFGQDALDPDKRIGGLIAKYESGDRDPAFLKAYVSGMTSAGMDPMEAADLYFKSLSDEQFATSDNLDMVMMMRPSLESEHFQRILDNYDAFAAVTDREILDKYLAQTCTQTMIKAIYNDDDKEYERLLNAVKAIEQDFAQEVVLYSEMRQAWGEGEYDDFIKYGTEYVQNYAWDDWNELNTIAWDIYEDDNYRAEDYLNFGLEMAKRSIELEENYYNTDTYAALLYKSGKYEEAKQFAELAIKLADDEELDANETKHLLAKIKAEML